MLKNIHVIKKLITTLLLFLLVSLAVADDPGMLDSLLIGNLDGSFIEACPGDTVNVPIWIKTDQDLHGMAIKISLVDQYVASYLGGYLFDVLDSANTPHWGYVQFTPPFSGCPVEGSTSYILGCSSMLFDTYDGPLLNTDSTWLKIVEYSFVLSDSSSNIGDTAIICDGTHPMNDKGTIFINDDYDSWYPIVVSGGIMIIPDGYAYLPGDVNMYTGAWPPVVVSGDMTYLVNFFRNFPCCPSCPLDNFWASADANGDCLVIGSDITKLQNYFRGTTILEYCVDYEPLWPTPNDLPPSAPSGWPNCE
ncbi:MAG: hypothetical protein GY839_11945 [candidate division Zixibacteria bacterium]|nr:hypothetical protein [candidate division Zixibacteria bacterium]